jgi:hypothetical protein
VLGERRPSTRTTTPIGGKPAKPVRQSIALVTMAIKPLAIVFDRALSSTPCLID